MRLATALLAVVTLAGWVDAASAAVTLDVHYGWGDLVRTARWTPITIRATDTQTRAAILEVYAPQGGTSAMRVRQFFTISSVPTTLQLYLPLRFNVSDALSVTVRDADTLKTLARFPEDPSAYNFNQNYTTSNAWFVGVSGVRTSLGVLGNRLGGRQAEVGYLPQEQLPAAPVGYDSLDLLVLDNPDLLHLEVERQNAILDWVRAGGNLLIWPADAPVPVSSPIVGALPCKIEGIKDYIFADADRKHFGLQIQGLRGRELVATEGAESVRILHNSSVDALRRRYGMGIIAVAPFDLSQLRNGNTQAMEKEFWQPLVSGMFNEDPQTSAQPNYSYYGVDPATTRELAAMEQVQDFLGDIPGAGQFGFTYVAVVLLGMMVIVGPVDWFVLRWMGRQPWTWVTTSGWIAAVTLGALFIGHWFRSGSLHYRTMRLVDQIGDETVGQVDVSCIYSPHTTDYHLDAPPTEEPATAPSGTNAPDDKAPPQHAPPPGWWQPASGGQDYYSRGTVTNDLDFRQSDEGNSPQAMYISIWNMRFLRCDTDRTGTPMLTANLLADPRTTSNPASASGITGTITNLTDRTLSNIRIQSVEGYALAVSNPNATAPAEPNPTRLKDAGPALIASLAPHASIRVNAVFQGDGRSTDTQNDLHSYPYSNHPTIEQSRLWRAAADLAGRRAYRSEGMLADGVHVCIYAEVSDPQPSAVLREPNALQRHYQVVRATVGLKGGRLPGRPPLATPAQTPAPDQ